MTFSTAIPTVVVEVGSPEPPIQQKTCKIIALNKDFIERFTGRSIESAGFNVVHQRIIAEMAKEYSCEKPPLIAGGSIVRYLIGKGQWHSDFDLWFYDEKSKQLLSNLLEPYKREKEGPFANSFDFPIGHRKAKVQLVNKPMEEGLVGLLTSFDLTVCQFLVLAGDGNTIYTTDVGFADLINRRLSLNLVHNPPYTKSRIMKYMKLGFVPDEECMAFLADEAKGPILPKYAADY